VVRPKRLIADKAYDVDRLRTWLKARHIRAAISSIVTRTVPYRLEPAACRCRNLIGSLFGRLKNWRRIATRYDRLARSDLAGSALITVVTEWTQ
jgi:transposase